MDELLKRLNEIEAGTEFEGADIPYLRNIYKLIVNDGYFITDKVIVETSSFSEKIYTVRPEIFGTVTAEQREEIEEIQRQIQRLKEEEKNGNITEL